MSMFKFEKQRELIKTYKRVFDSEDGQVVLYELMKKGYMLNQTYDTKDSDQALRNEGRRELVLEILKNLNYDMERLSKQIEKYAQKSREV